MWGFDSGFGNGWFCGGRFGCGWFCGGWSMTGGLVASVGFWIFNTVGFEASLEAGGIVWYQVYHPDSAKPAIPTDTAKHNAALPC